MEDTASLCTDDRDPRPWLCNDRARIDLLTVVPLARALVGDVPLVRVSHRPGIDLDGRATSWFLTFAVGESLTQVVLSADGDVGMLTPPGELGCEPAGLQVVDSVAAVRSAIRRYEASEGPLLVGPDTSLVLLQNDGCYLWSEPSVGSARRVRIAQPRGSWFAELDAAGNVRAWLGPCPRGARVDDCREAAAATP
ncbi:MAG: hypothetical protein AAF447_22545 [Myxococcota bacterium]